MADVQEGTLLLLIPFVAFLAALTVYIRRSVHRCRIRQQITGHEPTSIEVMAHDMECVPEEEAVAREDAIKLVSPRMWYKMKASYSNVARTEKEEGDGKGAPDQDAARTGATVTDENEDDVVTKLSSFPPSSDLATSVSYTRVGGTDPVLADTHTASMLSNQHSQSRDVGGTHGTHGTHGTGATPSEPSAPAQHALVWV
jgi:hypothetical protein